MPESPRSSAPARSGGETPTQPRYWCLACAYTFGDAETAIAHHEATGHYCTHRSPATRAAERAPAVARPVAEATTPDEPLYADTPDPEAEHDPDLSDEAWAVTKREMAEASRPAAARCEITATIGATTVRCGNNAAHEGDCWFLPARPVAADGGASAGAEIPEDIALALSDLQRESRAVGEYGYGPDRGRFEREEAKARAECDAEIRSALSAARAQAAEATAERDRLREALERINRLPQVGLTFDAREVVTIASTALSPASTPTTEETTVARDHARTEILDGKIEIGATLTFAATFPNYPRRAAYRGLVFDIRTWPDGCDYAAIAVLGMADVLYLRLEPLSPASPPPGAER
jgi:hypothetical protein